MTAEPVPTALVRIRAEGRPAPKGSRIQGITKAGHTYTRPASKYEQPWVSAVRDATRQAIVHQPPPGPPYELDVEIIVPARIRPNLKRQHSWPSVHDLDKLLRAVVDGLVAGGAMTDDRHVIRLTASKRFAQPGEQPGASAIVSGPAVIT